MASGKRLLMGGEGGGRCLVACTWGASPGSRHLPPPPPFPLQAGILEYQFGRRTALADSTVTQARGGRGGASAPSARDDTCASILRLIAALPDGRGRRHVA